MRRTHPLFWLTLAFLVLAVVIAATAHARAPGYALNSGAVYRIELALAVLVAAYDPESGVTQGRDPPPQPEMKRSGDEVERNLRKASWVLRRANGNGRTKPA